SFKTSMETPTVYLIEPNGKPQRVLLVSGMPYDRGGFRTAWSDDGCQTFTELNDFYDNMELRTIVAHASLTRLRDKHGWQDRWMGIFHDGTFNNWKTYLTFDQQGNEQWSVPQRLLEEHDAIEKMAQLCEIEVVRSPDGQELALLARAQKKVTNAMVAFSTDEGEHWTAPVELPRVLMGERHKACYNRAQDRLVVTFRDIIRNPQQDEQWMAGDLMAWVGRYDDLHGRREGDYTVRLGKDYSLGRGGDCGYAGNVLTGDNTFAVTSYGHWDQEAPTESYVITALLDLTETDRLASN
ncbi:MAG: sialidase family protein, partial [Angelakisella sp.]